ncbi:hypothetical protein [Rahnella sp. PAMC 25559]|uniref:hypothetical protein n=1 Tax=Rahnella sp. PAMC 25559 TaxID=3423225 RepID=UPI003D66B9F4
MSQNKYGESHKDAMEKLSNELSAFTHEDVVVEVKTNNNSQIGIGGGGPGLGGRDRRDTGH